jgi:hypothetical protein
MSRQLGSGENARRILRPEPGVDGLRALRGAKSLSQRARLGICQGVPKALSESSTHDRIVVMSYIAIVPNPLLELFPKRAKRARKLLRKAKRKRARRNSKRR